jgi:hypothetical protein
MNAYEKLRKQVSDDLAPHTSDVGKGIAEISSNFKMLGLETAVWHPEKIHTANLGGIAAETYLGYAKIEGRWGLVLRIIERDQNSGQYVSQRILMLESCSNLEILANALGKIGELAACIHIAINQQVKAIEPLGGMIKSLQHLEL